MQRVGDSEVGVVANAFTVLRDPQCDVRTKRHAADDRTGRPGDPRTRAAAL